MNTTSPTQKSLSEILDEIEVEREFIRSCLDVTNHRCPSCSRFIDGRIPKLVKALRRAVQAIEVLAQEPGNMLRSDISSGIELQEIAKLLSEHKDSKQEVPDGKTEESLEGKETVADNVDFPRQKEPETFPCSWCKAGVHDLTREIEVIRNEGRCSVSMMQRRFKYGYAHALEVCRQLEARDWLRIVEGGKCELSWKILLSEHSIAAGADQVNQDSEQCICHTANWHVHCPVHDPSPAPPALSVAQRLWTKETVARLWTTANYGQKYQAIADAHNASVAQRETEEKDLG